MIYTDKNKRSIYIRCDCGNESITLDKFESKGEPSEYFISVSVGVWLRGYFKHKLKMAWHILRYGTYEFAEICLNEENFKQLKELITKYE